MGDQLDNSANITTQSGPSDDVYSLYKKNDEVSLNEGLEKSREIIKQRFKELVIISVLIFVGLILALILGLIPVYIASSNSTSTDSKASSGYTSMSASTLPNGGSTRDPISGGPIDPTLTTKDGDNRMTSDTASSRSGQTGATLTGSAASTQQPTTQTTTVATTTPVPTTTCMPVQNITSIYPIDYNSNRCPNVSFYEPNFLKLETSYSFGYPIFQVIACPGSTLYLWCPNNQMIHIYSMYFGLQSATNTGYCSVASNIVSTICFFNVDENRVNQCEGESTCSIQIYTYVFGNPCLGLPYQQQQLLVQYQCVDRPILDEQISQCRVNTRVSSICPTSLPTGRQQRYAYQPSSLTLNCSSTTFINITCAYFGIDPNIRNPNSNYNGAPRKYYSQTSFDYVASSCNGRSVCTMSTTSTSTIDSSAVLTCDQFRCMLFAQWDCVSWAATSSTRSASATTTQASTTFQMTTGIPYCPYSQLPTNGTCQQTSPYEPEFTSNSSQLYFGYPVATQVLCENARLVLVCSGDLVIHIYAAYYGVQQPTAVTSTCVQASDGLEINAKCYVRQGFDVIEASCERKSSCNLRVSTATMGGPDLCPKMSKQLFVQYQCVDSKVLDYVTSVCPRPPLTPPICPSVVAANSSTTTTTTMTHSQTWCDGESMSIVCANNLNISIECAFYGLDPTLEDAPCGIGLLTYEPVCYLASSMSRIDALCTGKPACSISDITDFFSDRDPCADLDKQLHVQWRCE